MYITRLIPLETRLQKKSVLLLGPRRTGKTALIHHQLKADKIYDLLESDVFLDLSRRPSLIRESLTGKERYIVIDEIQKLPVLMDEVHSMIENHRVKFLLTASSGRKLKRTHTSLMAGRAKAMRLFPLVSAEISDFHLERALVYGLLPPVYLSDDPWDELKDYVGIYLREEIQAEALTRNIDHFSRFLHTAALSHGEIINFESVGRDAQVAPRTIREYYSVLEDTLVGTMLEPFKKIKSRKAVSRGKFYFFDIGVVHALTGQKQLVARTPSWGKAFEHLIFHEISAYLSYYGKAEELSFYRTTTGQEVDFIIGDSLGIEVKATHTANEHDLKGLQSASEDMTLKRRILVSQDKEKRKLGKTEIYPVHKFLAELWEHKIV